VARLLVLVLHRSDPPARLGDWLREAGAELDERHLRSGDACPESLDGFDGMVVLGGPQSATDDDAARPELACARALLKQALDADFPTLALCLGAQLLAQAGGGRVRKGVEGPEVGALLVAKRDAADGDPLFAPLPLSPDVVQFHHDEISELPGGATLLASSPMYAHQAFRVGRHVYGMQFHIETAPEMVHEWAARDTVGVAASPYDRETICLMSDEAHPHVEEAWRPFAARFADLVRAHARQAA